MLIPIFLPLGPHNREATCMMKRAINTCPSWEAKQECSCSWLMGEGNKGRGGGSHNVCCIPKNNLPQLSHVSRQEGIKSGLFSPSLSLCSPLMPPNQPGGDIIILEPGVTVGRTPGAGSFQCVSVFTCTCVCVHVCACAWQLGSLWPHHHCVSQPQPVQTCTLSCQPQCTFSVSPSHTHTLTHSHSLTLTGSRYPVEKGKTPELTYLFEYCQWLHTSGFVSLKLSKH